MENPEDWPDIPDYEPGPEKYETQYLELRDKIKRNINSFTPSQLGKIDDIIEAYYSCRPRSNYFSEELDCGRKRKKLVSRLESIVG